MMTLSIGGHHLALAEPGPWFYIERYTLLGGLVTGPLFGWFGWQWRSRRAVVGALITAAAFCLEPAARRLAEKPIHFANVALAEIVVGLAFAAAVLIRKARRPI